MKDEIKTLLLFDHHLDVSNRTVFLFEEISDESALRVIKSLTYLDQTPGDITININSTGGDVPSGFAILDCIAKLKNSTRGHVSGQASSMAVDVLQMCKHQTMSKFAFIMIHSGSIAIEGEAQAAKNQTDSMFRDLEMSIEFWLKKVKVSRKKLKEMLATDTYLYHKDALRHGFVDEVL